ncbi:Annexin A10 [Tupaia chinensis]|uniref:Annexin n=1 Tax=Tupaia chinensis TaxID=246437 RepID=L8YDM1_TUPCH|nr:Annexin A10 [Tupaia chinensis]
MLINILTQRCNAQRLMIAEAYQSMYGRDLIGDLKEQLSHHFKDVMVGLMYPPPSYDAHELWHAMKGVGTDENCLIDILASRTNGEIFQMREAYCLQYGNNLQEDIYSETSGHFRDVLMNLVQDFGFHNKTIIRILIARSEIDLLTIRKRYKERYGKSLFHDIRNFASGHYEKALLAICAGDAEDY